MKIVVSSIPNSTAFKYIICICSGKRKKGIRSSNKTVALELLQCSRARRMLLPQQGLEDFTANQTFSLVLIICIVKAPNLHLIRGLPQVSSQLNNKNVSPNASFVFTRMTKHLLCPNNGYYVSTVCQTLMLLHCCL